MNDLAFNKVCEVEDFDNVELREIIDEVFVDVASEINRRFSHGLFCRKYWEIAMTVRALRHFGAVHDKALILGVGAGTEITSFFLTNHVKMVYATDMYQNAGEWKSYAPATMITNPGLHASIPFRRERLIVQHMNGCNLNYPDNMFDGIYSSSSIEHFGSLAKISKASAEMGRVLKPGGILTLSTEYKVDGPGDGWDPNNTVVLSKEKIEKFIIEPSGLELVDEISVQLSHETMKCRRDLETIIDKSKDAPNILISHKGYTFCSVHLTLRKGKS